MRLVYSNGVLSIEIAGRTRKIGEIKNRVLTIYRNREQHLMRKYSGYGFNEAVMKDGRLFDYVMVEDEDKEGFQYYLVSREDILIHGVVDQAEEFERQLFMSIEKLQKLNELAEDY